MPDALLLLTITAFLRNHNEFPMNERQAELEEKMRKLSRTLQGRVMRWLIGLAILLSVTGLLVVASTEAALASTGNTLEVSVLPGRAHAIIYIYGPNGYYRSADMGPSTKYYEMASFYAAPYGSYRIRIHWNVNGREDNWYGNPFPWWHQNGSCRSFWFVYDGAWGGPNSC